MRNSSPNEFHPAVAMTYALQFRHGWRVGQIVPIPTVGDFFIGRSRRCELRILSAAVSRIHCSLRYRDGELLVNDENSLTGTFLNGERLFREHVLSYGDLLRVGPIKLEVVPDRFESFARHSCDWPSTKLGRLGRLARSTTSVPSWDNGFHDSKRELPRALVSPSAPVNSATESFTERATPNQSLHRSPYFKRKAR